MSEISDRLYEAMTALDRAIALQRQEPATVGGVERLGELLSAVDHVICAMEALRMVGRAGLPTHWQASGEE